MKRAINAQNAAAIRMAEGMWRGGGSCGGIMTVLGPGDLVCQAPQDESTSRKGSCDDIAPCRLHDHRDTCVHLLIPWYPHEMYPSKRHQERLPSIVSHLTYA